MTSNGLPIVEKNVSAATSYLVGSTRVSQKENRSDHNTIVAGLTLFFGILLDYNLRFCNADKVGTNQGRIVKSSASVSGVDFRLDGLLQFLDGVGDVLLKHISSDYEFKAHNFLLEAKTVECETMSLPIRASIISLLSSLEDSDLESVQFIRVVRQITCFLKKLDIDRGDLNDIECDNLKDFERSLAIDVPMRRCWVEYQRDIHDMKAILMSHLDCFSLEPFVPRHGPGASASTSVHCWLDKHREACSDARVGYLLDHTGLGSQKDYLPLIKEEKSSRTSRYICVPKTWKKLRGISAEPVELMYFQQAVLYAIDRMFRHDKWWSSRIDLHSQDKSRQLTLIGSIDESFATIDLSAASDSVTLQLVQDLFGNTELARWLIGTRSTHTLVKGTTVKLNKFAPMGSACCFPVECIVFALAAEVAVRRSYKTSYGVRQSRIFGDDIIIPTYATQELLAILDHLGFTVNSEKSYWSGRFREACGAECWAGHDIAPCRFKNLRGGLRGQYTDQEEMSSMVAMANKLFDKGLHGTREYLLSALFAKRVCLKGRTRKSVTRVSAQRCIFASFSGECGTLASPVPTNFQLDWKVDSGLQTKVCKRLYWVERPRKKSCPAEDSADLDVCKYVEWLIRHQDGVTDFDALWSDGWLEVTLSSNFSRIPIGTVMVPTYRWVLPVSLDTLTSNASS